METEEEPTRIRLCCDWARRRLETGATVPTRQFEAEARAEGFTQTTLDRARALLGVAAERIPLGRGWRVYWPHSLRPPGDQSPSTGVTP
jgi:hypothetical protein